MGHKFGGMHTEKKLGALEKYLRAYTIALKKQNFNLFYFDAFAGTGDIQIAANDATLLEGIDEYSPFVKGSAQRALSMKRAFSRYIFVDNAASKVADLEKLRASHSDIADIIEVRKGDANEELIRFCHKTNWENARAVVFLDPYGNQVRWDTIEAIAATERIDLWYLFPAFLGVDRQISKQGAVHPTHVPSLDQLLGTREWRNSFIKTEISVDLFGSREIQEKRTTVESVTRFMVERMRSVFRGGVLDEWLPLGSNGAHWYSLLFAWANPSPKAKLAEKLAKDVMRSTRNGRR